MDDQTRRELRRLRIQVYVSTALIAVLAFAAFRRAEPVRFEEISVERINIVEPDGKLRLVISNRARSPGPIAYGKPFGYPGGGRPGMIFFNDEETENGGLTFTGHMNEDGTYRARTGLSFDQFNQDQVVVLEYVDQNGQRRLGLSVLDRTDEHILDLVERRDSILAMPEGPARTAALQKLYEPRPGEPIAAQRLFAGRVPSKSAVVVLSDRAGKPRLRMSVDSLGTASIEFLDADGRVIHRLPEEPARP